MTADLQNPMFTDLDAAREALENARWPNGPYCPHCGGTDRQAKVEGTKHRPGLYYCNHCQSTYTVTVGTVFERSKVPLTKWWLATHLLTSSRKGMSAHQLHRMLGVTYKTAWFMAHRIREAMGNDKSGPLGGEGKTIEADETILGPSEKTLDEGNGLVRKGRPGRHRVVTLVERGGKAKSVRAEHINSNVVQRVLFTYAHPKSVLNTDEAGHYKSVGVHFAGHHTVNHSKAEYARGRTTTNTVEGFFSIFKRGMIGTYQHCGENHLHRYLAEFDYRYNTRTALGVDDKTRAEKLLAQIAGKRLTYRRTRLGA